MMYYPMKALILAMLSAPLRVQCIQEISVPVDFDGDQVAQLEIVDSSSSFSQRALQDNPNCDVTSETTCVVTSENNVRCEDFSVTEETCRDINIKMTYEMCNQEQQRTVTLIQSKTVAKSFLQELDITGFKSSPLSSGECRSTDYTTLVDSCATKRIVGSLKVEGHSDPSQVGYYCYAFSYYSAKIFTSPTVPITSSPTKRITSAPTSSPTKKVTSRPTADLFEISVDPIAECYIDNGRFDTTCAQYLATVPDGDSRCVVDVVYKYNVENTGSVCENINLVTSSINGSAAQIVPLDNLQGRNFCPGDKISFLDGKSNIQLCNLRGQELSFNVAVNGGGDGRVGECVVIFPEINIVTFAPTSSPTRKVTSKPTATKFGEINYEFTMECLMETIKSSLLFNVPCDSVNFKSFSPQDLRRNVMFRFIITNKSTEPIEISNLMMQSELTNGPVEIASSLDDISIGVGKQVTLTETFLVPFGNFNNQNLEVDAAVDAVGSNSAKTRTDNDKYFISVPDLFEISVDPDAQCYIDNGRFDTTCAQYLATVSDGDSRCVVDVVYRYNVENTGSVCENINLVTSSINGGAAQIVPLDNLQGRNFCPGETISVLDGKSNMQLCNLRGKEHSVEVAVNGGGGGRVGECVIVFPEGNSVTPAPSPSGKFDIVIESALCIVNIDSRSISCQDFINEFSSLIGTNDPTCYNDVTYRFNVKNIGNGCGFIQDIKTTVNGDITLIDIDGWNQERRRFCQNESLIVRRPEANVNVCALAGSEIDLAIKINNAEAEDFIALLEPNSVPTPTIPQGPKDCSQHPEKLVFQFTGDTCNRSVNKQGRRTRRTRLLRNLGSGKGKGSDKKPPSRPNPSVPAPAPVPVPGPDITDNEGLYNCNDFQLLTDASAKITVTNLDATLLLFDGTVSEGSTFSIGDPKHLIPDDIRIQVYNGYGALLQSVKLHSSCSTVMSLGETFGSFKLVGFTNKEGTSSI